MPYKSDKQARFFRMCRHNPKHAKGKCPSQKVTQEFEDAEQAKEHPRAAAVRGLRKKGGR